MLICFVITDLIEQGLSQGVILLVDSSWFLGAVSRADDKKTGTKFLLYHPNFGILKDKSTNQEMTDLSDILKNSIKDNQQSGNFTYLVNSVKHVIDYQVLGESELYLVRLRDSTILQKEILYLRLKILGIAAIFIIVVVIGGLLVNKQVYQPFYSIVAEIRESMGKNLNIPEDDLDLLNALYGTIRDEYSESGENRIISNCLRSLTQEELEKPGELIEILNNRGINLSIGNPGALCLISIDDIDDEFGIELSETISSYPALKFRFRNGTLNAISELGLGSAAIFLRRGVMLLLLYSSEKNISPNEESVLILHKMISEFMDTSISIVWSGILSELSNLRHVYLSLSAAIHQRYLLGRGVYLLTSEIKTAPDEMAQKKVEKLRTDIIASISNQIVPSDNLKSYLEILRNWTVKAAQDEINAFSLSLTRTLSNRDTDFQTQDLFKNLINQPTLDDFYTIVEAFAKENEGGFHLTESRHSALIDLARDMIEKNHSDPRLCMASIAEELKMSPTYFGIIFKKAVGTPFSNYLTMVRIQEAAHLLKTTRNSVQEIMVLVGILSESTFYRRFREIFNLTPQLFRQQSVLNFSDKKIKK